MVSAMAGTYHPWRLLRSLAALTIDTDADLPPGILGDLHDGHIRIRRGLSQTQRRMVLSHELAHYLRGALDPIDPVLRAREEAAVDALAACSLIPIVDALRWTRSPAEAAGELWVDVPMLNARLDALSESERALLDAIADDDAAA